MGGVGKKPCSYADFTLNLYSDKMIDRGLNFICVSINNLRMDFVPQYSFIVLNCEDYASLGLCAVTA